MRLYVAAMILFLFAFLGLAMGLLLKRKGLRGGCRPAAGSAPDCQCQATGETGLPTGAARPEEVRQCEECPVPSPQGKGSRPPGRKEPA